MRSETARHDAAVQAHRAEGERHNASTGTRRGLESDRESVQAYLEIALSRTPIPDGLPGQVEVAYTPHGEQAVVRVELPPLEVIPTVESYTYVATSGKMREKTRAKGQVAQLYRSVVSQIALLYLRDLFEADAGLENVELGGHVHAVNPATGQRAYPCLISVAVDRRSYDTLNLRDVTPEACLKHLNALVHHPPPG